MVVSIETSSTMAQQLSDRSEIIQKQTRRYNNEEDENNVQEFNQVKNSSGN